MAEHRYRTSMGRANKFSKVSCEVSVVTPPFHSTVSSLSQMPGPWAHKLLTQARSHRSGASALNQTSWMRSRQSTETQQHSWVQVPDEGACQQLGVFSIFIAIVGSPQAQFSIKYQKRKREWEFFFFIKADNRRPLWGPLCEALPQTDTTVCNFLADPSGVKLF